MKKFLISIVFILVCVCCFAFAVDDQSSQNTSGDVYYPVVFTSEWKTLILLLNCCRIPSWLICMPLIALNLVINI